MLAWRKAASSGVVLRSPSPDGVSVDGLVEVSSEYCRTELEVQVPDEQQQRDAHRPSFSALIVDGRSR